MRGDAQYCTRNLRAFCLQTLLLCWFSQSFSVSRFTLPRGAIRLRTLLYFLGGVLPNTQGILGCFVCKRHWCAEFPDILLFLYLPSLGVKSDSCRIKTQHQRQKRTPDLSPTPPMEGSGSNLESVSVSDISFFNLGQPIRGGAGGWSPQWK